MKAAIVTFVRAYNYGAVLQSYALSKVVRQYGVDVEVLDYFPSIFRSQYSLAYLGNIRYFPYRPIKNWLKFVPVLRTIRKRNRNFSCFINRYIPLSSDQYKTIDEIICTNKSYQAYIAGSDQVWSHSCASFDEVFFLDFHQAKQAKRYSYAASFGTKTIPDTYRDEYYRRLKNWDKYSVREESGKGIIKELLGADAVQCVDPTLLITENEWYQIAKKPARRKPYILVYSVNGINSVLEQAKALAAVKDLDVVYIPCILQYEKLMGYDAKEKGFIVKNTISPSEWIGYFADAEYVLTDSFHGTVFSVLFHKKFVVATEYSWGNNTRVYDFLDLLQLKDRVMSRDVFEIDREISWATIDNNLTTIIERSLMYINEMIGDMYSADRECNRPSL